MKFRCVVHGSFGRHMPQIRSAIKTFARENINVLAPRSSEITAINGSFLLLEDEETLDPRYVELRYLQNLQLLGQYGFSYFVNPSGYIGKSSAFELGIALATGVPCFFSSKPKDLPVYVPKSNILSPQDLVRYISDNNFLPKPNLHSRNIVLHKMLNSLTANGSIVAAGGVVQYQRTSTSLPEVLLVKTHKWKGRYSIVGGKIKRNEKLHEGLMREIAEETGLKAVVEKHLVTFDQIKQSGYYRDYINHIFIDYIATTSSKKVSLNDEAQDFVWIPAEEALAELDIEPNARHTLEVYCKNY